MPNPQKKYGVIVFRHNFFIAVSDFIKTESCLKKNPAVSLFVDFHDL